MKYILAIGGAVIKTALEELREVVNCNKVEMLIHNGASVFHDFQRAIDPYLIETGNHSYPLSDLIEDKGVNKQASNCVWDWLRYKKAPDNSITKLCIDKGIPVLCFSALGTDFWQMFDNDWELFARTSNRDFDILTKRMTSYFHYLLLGSAVIHPEVFRSALCISKSSPRGFKADVVDFKDMYRPRTRVAIYGKYYQMEFKPFLEKLIKEDV